VELQLSKEYLVFSRNIAVRYKVTIFLPSDVYFSLFSPIV